MKQFHLQICTPSGTWYDGEAGQLSVRGSGGSLSILAGHIPYTTAVVPHECRVYTPDGAVKTGHCGEGFVTTDGTVTRMILSSFSWE